MQADETFQALAWSWGVPSIIPAGDLNRLKDSQQEIRLLDIPLLIKGTCLQEIISKISIEGSAKAQSLSVPVAVQLQIQASPLSIIVQPQPNARLQLCEHRGQLAHLNRI